MEASLYKLITPEERRRQMWGPVEDRIDGITNGMIIVGGITGISNFVGFTHLSREAWAISSLAASGGLVLKVLNRKFWDKMIRGDTLPRLK